MKEWKIRQQIYNDIIVITDFAEDYDVPIFIDDTSEQHIINHIVDYFTIPVAELIFPAKSYAVAIIYAKLITHYFNEDFYEILNDPTLLYENDKYFMPYMKAQNIYDQALSQIPNDLNIELPQIQATINFFEDEFFIKTKT